MKKGMMVFTLCGLVAGMDAYCAHPTLSKSERVRDSNQRYFDLVISMNYVPEGNNNGNHQPAQDSQYSKQDEIEAIIQYWADAEYQSTQGAHLLRNINIFVGGENMDTCDVRWVKHPDAGLGGYLANKPHTLGRISDPQGSPYLKDYIYFVENSPAAGLLFTGDRLTWEQGGYTLGHEGGHYLYGLYDEYIGLDNAYILECQRVKCSIMGDYQPAFGQNYKYLNFSIQWQGGEKAYKGFREWENTRMTWQHAIFQRSCWETMAADLDKLPAPTWFTSKNELNARDSLRLQRPYYPELRYWAPKGTNAPIIKLDKNMPLANLPSREKLNIIWNPRPAKTVVIDRSSSMAGGGLDNAKSAACGLIDRIETGTAVSILAFDASVSLVHNFLVITNSANRTELKTAVNGIALGSGTAIGDAARTALNNLVSYGLSNRTATVYLLTDGGNNLGEDPYAVIPDYLANHVSFYGLGYGIEADVALAQMAMATGGTFVNGLASVMDVKEAFIEADALLSDRVIVAKGSAGPGITAVDIPIVIDSTLTNDFRLTVNVSGGPAAASLTLAPPGGAPALTATPQPESDGSATWDFWVAAPAQGVWLLTGTKQAGAELRYICDAKKRGGSYHLSIAAAEWSAEEGALGVFASLGYVASTDGAVVTAQLVLTNGVVMDAVCTNFATGVYAAVFAGGDKWLFEGAKVTVTASNPNGEAFETWREATCGVSQEMPDVPITENFMRVATMTVVFPRLKLTVLEGTGSGRYRPGETVAIAPTPTLPSHQFVFTSWIGDTQTVANVTQRQTTITVTNDMTVQAIYRAIPLPPPENFLIVNLATGATEYRLFHEAANAAPGTPAYTTYRQDVMMLRRITPDPMGDSYLLWWLNGNTYHEIDTRFSRVYYIGVFPVTQGQWHTLMGAYPPSTYQGADYPFHPAEQVSYADIRGSTLGGQWPGVKSVDSNSFIGKLRAISGGDFDLPTEGQWNRVMLYNWPLPPLSLIPEENVAWTSLNSGGTTKVVGTKPSGALGLFDMVGNVKEWCLDWSGSPGPDGTLIVDPVGPSSGTQRIQRGGSFKTSVSDTGDYGLSSYMRWGATPSTRADDVGFRVVFTYDTANVTINGTAQNIPVGMATPVSATNQPGYRFTGWAVDTTAASLGGQFVTNAPNTLVVIPPSATLTLTPLYEPLPLPDPPWHDVTYEEAPVLVTDFKVGVADGAVTLSWGGLQNEEVMGYAIEAKAALTDPGWDALFLEDGVEITEDGAGGFTASIPQALSNTEGEPYRFFRIRAVTERPTPPLPL